MYRMSCAVLVELLHVDDFGLMPAIALFNVTLIIPGIHAVPKVRSKDRSLTISYSLRLSINTSMLLPCKLWLADRFGTA